MKKHYKVVLLVLVVLLLLAMPYIVRSIRVWINMRYYTIYDTDELQWTPSPENEEDEEMEQASSNPYYESLPDLLVVGDDEAARVVLKECKFDDYGNELVLGITNRTDRYMTVYVPDIILNGESIEMMATGDIGVGETMYGLLLPPYISFDDVSSISAVVYLFDGESFGLLEEPMDGTPIASYTLSYTF